MAIKHIPDGQGFVFDKDFGFSGSSAPGVNSRVHRGERGVDRREDVAPRKIGDETRGFAEGGAVGGKARKGGALHSGFEAEEDAQDHGGRNKVEIGRAHV